MIIRCILFLYFSSLTFQLPLLSSLLAERRGRDEHDPMICTEVSVNHTLVNLRPDEDPFPNVTVLAKMLLFQDKKTPNYFIRLSDVEAHDLTHNLSATATCYEAVNRQCNFNVTSFYNFDLNEFDPLHQFGVYFVRHQEAEIDIYGDGFSIAYVSNGNLINLDGALFSVDEPCHLWSLDQGSEKRNLTLCCTKTVPAPKTPLVSRCKRFQSDLVFYNGDNTVFASSTMNYTLNGNQLHTQGNYTNVTSFPYPAYFFNGLTQCGSAEDSQLRCNVTLPQGDSNIFIAMAYSEITEHGYYDYYSRLRAAIVGSFILRNDQTLMYEGVPFTPQNACVSYIGHNYLNKPSLCQFCCKEFE